MVLLQWIIGPQLIGMIFIIAALLQKRFPPKEINSLYGYRTKRSMQDQQNWDEGNRYSTRLMLKAGVVLIITGLVVTAVMQQTALSEEVKAATKIGLILAGAFATVIVMFRATEKHLKQTFGDTD